MFCRLARKGFFPAFGVKFGLSRQLQENGSDSVVVFQRSVVLCEEMMAATFAYTAVAKLRTVVITNFAKLVMAWEAFGQKPKKLFANVGFDAIAVWV